MIRYILAALFLFACAASADATNFNAGAFCGGQQQVSYDVQNFNGGYAQQFNGGHVQNFNGYSQNFNNGYGQQQRRFVQRDFVVNSYRQGNFLVEEFNSGRVRRTRINNRPQFFVQQQPVVQQQPIIVQQPVVVGSPFFFPRRSFVGRGGLALAIGFYPANLLPRRTAGGS